MPVSHFFSGRASTIIERLGYLEGGHGGGSTVGDVNDDFNLEGLEGLDPIEDLAPVDLAAEMPATETLPPPAAEPISQDEAVAEPTVATTATASRLPQYLEWGALVGIPVVLVALATVQFIYFATALYLLSAGFVGYGIWRGRATGTIYTVLLGCAVIAILTALYCLWIELGRYQFNIRAKPPYSMVQSPVVDSRDFSDVHHRRPMGG
jgi:hypothetical protein